MARPYYECGALPIEATLACNRCRNPLHYARIGRKSMGVEVEAVCEKEYNLL